MTHQLKHVLMGVAKKMADNGVAKPPGHVEVELTILRKTGRIPRRDVS